MIAVDQPIPLAPALDRAALIGEGPAHTLFGYAHHASTIYIRTDVSRTSQLASLLARTAYPQEPSDVLSQQPTAALAARAATVGTSAALLIDLVAITLTVAGIGIANVMIIAVLERRHEIGTPCCICAASSSPWRAMTRDTSTCSGSTVASTFFYPIPACCCRRSSRT